MGGDPFSFRLFKNSCHSLNKYKTCTLNCERRASNDKTLIMKHVFTGRRRTTLKLASRFLFFFSIKANWLADRSVTAADRVGLPRSEGLRHNLLQQVRRQSAAGHYLRI